LSGLHGDERSGPIFLTELLESWTMQPQSIPRVDLLMVPLANDQGWESRLRAWRGIDLNRDFKAGTTSPVGALMEVYRSSPISLHWDIHEDDEKPSLSYLYHYSLDEHDMVPRLASHLDCPMESWSDWDTSSECYVRSLGVKRALTSEVAPGRSLPERLDWLNKAFGFIAAECETLGL
jgi:hypothetical protein